MSADLHTIVVGRDAMACRFEVVFNAGEVADAAELGVDALDLVDEIESRITVYRDTSELARVNATAVPLAGMASLRISIPAPATPFTVFGSSYAHASYVSALVPHPLLLNRAVGTR